MTRFVVQTVTGYPFTVPISESGTHAREGLSAHVCDRVYLHEVVATYRSTEIAPGQGARRIGARRIGADGAQALAEAHAARLNDGR